MVDANRMRLMKEKANHDVDKQCTTKYEQESKFKGIRHLSKQEMEEYIKSIDKDQYLRSIGKFSMEGC